MNQEPITHLNHKRMDYHDRTHRFGMAPQHRFMPWLIDTIGILFLLAAVIFLLIAL